MFNIVYYVFFQKKSFNSYTWLKVAALLFCPTDTAWPYVFQCQTVIDPFHSYPTLFRTCSPLSSWLTLEPTYLSCSWSSDLIQKSEPTSQLVFVSDSYSRPVSHWVHWAFIPFIFNRYSWTYIYMSHLVFHTVLSQPVL